MKFRKKPVTIEAFQAGVLLHCAKSAWKELPECIVTAYDKGEIIFKPREIEIKTLEGWMIGNYDDYIIQGVKGELYPCKPDIFEATHIPDEQTAGKKG